MLLTRKDELPVTGGIPSQRAGTMENISVLILLYHGLLTRCYNVGSALAAHGSVMGIYNISP